MIKVSIIVPVFKAEKCLNKCVDSILLQTFTEFELILVDDGSPDSSGKICDEYALKDSRVKVFHKENGGVSSARNVGIKNATNDYLCFVDSDDYVDSDFLESLVLGLSDDIDLSQCAVIAEREKTKIEYSLKEYRGKIKDFFKSFDYSTAEGLLCTCVTKIFNRKILIDNGIFFNEGLSIGEDATFVMEYLSKINTVNIIPKFLYHYDQTTENSGVKKLHENSDECILSMQKALENIFDIFSLKSKEQIEYKQKFIIEKWKYCISICIFLKNPKVKKIKILCKWLNSFVKTNDSQKVFIFPKKINKMLNGKKDIDFKTTKKIIEKVQAFDRRKKFEKAIIKFRNKLLKKV